MRFSSRTKKILFFMLIIALVLAPAILLARAGGAGGSSGGGSSSSGDSGLIGYLIYLIIRVVPFPFNVILIVAILIGYARVQKALKKNSRAFTTPLEPPAGQDQKLQVNLDLPGQPFDSNAFKAKVEKAFKAIQDGWSKGELKGVRRYISDGINQRFLTQFKMMEVLEQRNELKHLQIQRIWIEKAEVQGSYQMVHCGIQAMVDDKFISPKFPQLNSGGHEKFTEFWTFIRRQDAKPGDLYGSVKCPNCGAPLEEDNLDVVNCPFCDSLLNNGSYDWILSEITQAQDWAASNKGMRKLSQINDKVSARLEQEDFAVQELEDKASNAFLQIKTALTLKEPQLMQRFVTSDFYETLKQGLSEQRLAYSRLYLNHVTLVGADSKDGKDILYMAIKSSCQRVELKDNGKAKLLDPYMVSFQEILRMERSQNPGRPKGSLFADRCPSCGAAITDSAALECSSCGEAYNSGRWDWVISGILGMEEYRQESSQASVSLSQDNLDSLYHWKDYVLNNIMFIIAADGKFAQEERDLATRISKKLGYQPAMLDVLYEQAAAGRLTIRMPEDAQAKVKIYRLMEKMAKADQDFSVEEETLLAQVRTHYGIAV